MILPLYFTVIIIVIIILFAIYPRLKTGLFFMSLLTAFVYILWRLTTIPNQGIHLVIGVLLLIAEYLGFIQFLLFCYISSRPKKEPISIKQFKELPTVDIVIPTYGEPLYIVKSTLAAALAIKYDASKKNIYVCDDGKRLEIKQLCDEFNVNYSVRVDNTHAKSGNINNMLEKSTGELIAVFDADMIPKNNFLEKIVPYFFDSKVGFVQTPQSFYNPDIFQKYFRKKIPCEQDFFMRDIQLKRSYIDAEIHVGTNAIFRRDALDSIGGYPTFSITEDIALGFLIQSRGYKSVFVNEPLAIGLNPTNLKDFLSQRDRWCRGNLQLLKSKNPFSMNGLRLNQKIAYLDGLFSWYSSILKMIFIIAPIFYLLTGVFFIDAPLPSLLIMFLPYFISQYLLFSTNSPNTRTMLWAHIYETSIAPYNAKSCIINILDVNALKFKVTNKDIKDNKNKIYFKEAFPHVFLISLTLLSLYIGFSKYLEGNLNLSIFLINTLWAIYNLLPMCLFVMIALQKDYNKDIDADVTDEIYLDLINGQNQVSYLLEKISETTITLKQNNTNVLLKGDTITLYLNKNIVQGKVIKSTNGKCVIKLIDLSNQSYIELISLYSTYLKPYYDLDGILANKPVH